MISLGVVRALREQILLDGAVFREHHAVYDAAAGKRRFTAGARLRRCAAHVRESEKQYAGNKRARAGQDHAKSMHLYVLVSAVRASGVTASQSRIIDRNLNAPAPAEQHDPSATVERFLSPNPARGDPALPTVHPSSRRARVDSSRLLRSYR